MALLSRQAGAIAVGTTSKGVVGSHGIGKVVGGARLEGLLDES